MQVSVQRYESSAASLLANKNTEIAGAPVSRTCSHLKISFRTEQWCHLMGFLSVIFIVRICSDVIVTRKCCSTIGVRTADPFR